MKLRFGFLLLSALLAGPALAAKDVKVKQLNDTQYEIDAFTMGINELGGYLASLKEDEGAERVVFSGRNEESELKIAALAAKIGLVTVRKNGDVIPAPPPAAAAPATEAAPATATAAAAPAADASADSAPDTKEQGDDEDSSH